MNSLFRSLFLARHLALLSIPVALFVGGCCATTTTPAVVTAAPFNPADVAEAHRLITTAGRPDDKGARIWDAKDREQFRAVLDRLPGQQQYEALRELAVASNAMKIDIGAPTF